VYEQYLFLGDTPGWPLLSLRGNSPPGAPVRILGWMREFPAYRFAPGSILSLNLKQYRRGDHCVARRLLIGMRPERMGERRAAGDRTHGFCRCLRTLTTFRLYCRQNADEFIFLIRFIACGKKHPPPLWWRIILSIEFGERTPARKGGPGSAVSCFAVTPENGFSTSECCGCPGSEPPAPGRWYLCTGRHGRSRRSPRRAGSWRS